MKSWFVLGLVAFAVPVAALAWDDETPSIKKIMGKLHKGSTSQTSVLKNQLKANPVDWDAVGKTTKDFVILGAAMAKNDPPKGDKDEWKKLAIKYFDNAKALDDAATGHDLDKLKAAQKSMGASCKSCHDAHKDDK